MLKLQEIRTLFFTFADINIQINLHKAKFYDSRSSEKIFRRSYQNFFLEKKPDRIDYCFDFLEGEPQFINIAGKKLASLIAEVKGPRRMNVYYTARLIHFQWILKYVIQKISKKILLLHASGAAWEKKAILFLGESGAGKSTIINLLRNHFKIIANDSVFIKNEGEFKVYQSPFVEQERWMKKYNETFKLHKIFFLKKAKYFKVKKITSHEEVYRLFINSVMLPKISKKGNLDFISNFIFRFHNFYYLYFEKKSQLHKYDLFGKDLENLRNSHDKNH